MIRVSVCAPNPSLTAWQVSGVGGGRGLVVLAGCVQADHGVEVDDAACLVLGDLDEPDAELAVQRRLGDPGQPGQTAGQVGGEPAPQVGRAGVEQHRGLVVVAVAAHGLAEPGLDVPGGAGDVPAVRAAPGPGVAAGAAGQDGLAAHPPGVDRAERRRGERREYARVACDRLRDALASGEPGADELPGVALVGRRAGGADGLAAVPARDGRLAVEGGEFAGCQVDHVGAGAELDRVRAGVLGGELVFPGAEVGAGNRGVVGGRPGSRARYGFGTRSGGRGSISRHSHHLSGSW
jgi:hypothetical protein